MEKEQLLRGARAETQTHAEASREVGGFEEGGAPEEAAQAVRGHQGASPQRDLKTQMQKRKGSRLGKGGQEAKSTGRTSSADLEEAGEPPGVRDLAQSRVSHFGPAVHGQVLHTRHTRPLRLFQVETQANKCADTGR